MIMLAAVLMTAFLGFVGILVDAGFAYAQRRQAQNAADNAALAATHVLFEGGSESAALAAAIEYADANGYASESITVHIPPISGNHVGEEYHAEVIVEEQPATFFIHAVIPGGSTVRGRGVAGAEIFPEPYALIVLEDHDCLAFDHVGQPNMTVTNGGIAVNSDCMLDAFYKSGGGNLTVDGQIDVHGGYTVDGNGIVSPDPRNIPWAVDDPLASLSPPSRGDPAPGSAGTAENPITWHHSPPADMSLSPGTYYGGFFSDCVCTITMEPGVYVMAGGGFAKAGGARIVGDGVTIYVTTNPTNPTGDGAPAGVSLAGSGVLELTPPTSGPYEGITFWQDAAITDDFILRGDNPLTQGLFYMPTARLDIEGGGALGAVQMVVNSFHLGGSGDLTLTYGEFREFESPDVVLKE
jgi:hypothetical protein